MRKIFIESILSCHNGFHVHTSACSASHKRNKLQRPESIYSPSLLIFALSKIATSTQNQNRILTHYRSDSHAIPSPSRSK